MNRLYYHLKNKGTGQNKPLYTISLMLFFVAIFDGILAFALPFLITHHGFNASQLGLIIGASSIFGALFDFFLSKFLSNTGFRRMYLAMFCLCLFYPALLWVSSTASLFILAMGVWGLYYDLMGFGSFDFVNRVVEKSEHAVSSGVMSVFKSLGYFLAPILAGLFVAQTVNHQVFGLAWFFLLAALLMFVLLLLVTKKQKIPFEKTTRRKINFLKEIYLWKKIGKQLFPVLIFVAMLTSFDAVFWTLGPLFSEELKSLHPLGGVLMAAYLLPPLFSGWLVGDLAGKFGQKRTAFYAFLLGSLTLILIAFCQSPALLVLVVFVASFFVSLGLPSIKGAVSDYISETGSVENEIEGLVDFFINLGYVVGPVLGGFIANSTGFANAFSILGAIGVVGAIIVNQLTPRHIRVRLR